MKKTIIFFIIVFFGFFFALPASAFTVYEENGSVFVWNGTPNEYPSYAYQLFNLTTGGYPIFTLEQNVLGDDPIEITEYLIENHKFGIIQEDVASCYTYDFDYCKYYWIYLAGGLRGFLNFSFPISIVSLPTGALDDLFATAGTLFSDLWVIIAIAIGVPLAFYIIKRAIGMVNKKAKHNRG